MVIGSKASGIIVTIVIVIMVFRAIYLEIKSIELASDELRVQALEAACIMGLECFAAIFYFGDQQLFKKALDLTTVSGIIFLVLFFIPIVITTVEIVKDKRGKH